MKKQINEIKRMQHLAGVLKEEAIPYAQWKSVLTQFIEKNLTNDIDENGNLIQVLQNIIDELKQEIDGSLTEENQGIENDIEQDLMQGDFESTDAQIEYLQSIITFCNNKIAELQAND
jgi:DNA-binding transcriptional regulator GbsR (MarR family)